MPNPVESMATEVTASITNKTINPWLDGFAWSSFMLGRVNGRGPEAETVGSSSVVVGSVFWAVRLLSWMLSSLWAASVFFTVGVGTNVGLASCSCSVCTCFPAESALIKQDQLLTFESKQDIKSEKKSPPVSAFVTPKIRWSRDSEFSKILRRRASRIWFW